MGRSRAIAAELPEVGPGSYHGYPALRVDGRFLTRLSDDGAGLEFKALDSLQRDLMLEAEPDIFFLPPRYAGRGVYARLAGLDAARLRELLAATWRRAAPARLVRALDGWK